MSSALPAGFQHFDPDSGLTVRRQLLLAIDEGPSYKAEHTAIVEVQLPFACNSSLPPAACHIFTPCCVRSRPHVSLTLACRAALHLENPFHRACQGVENLLMGSDSTFKDLGALLALFEEFDGGTGIMYVVAQPYDPARALVLEAAGNGRSSLRDPATGLLLSQFLADSYLLHPCFRCGSFAPAYLSHAAEEECRQELHADMQRCRHALDCHA